MESVHESALLLLALPYGVARNQDPGDLEKGMRRERGGDPPGYCRPDYGNLERKAPDGIN